MTKCVIFSSPVASTFGSKTSDPHNRFEAGLLQKVMQLSAFLVSALASEQLRGDAECAKPIWTSIFSRHARPGISSGTPAVPVGSGGRVQRGSSGEVSWRDCWKGCWSAGSACISVYGLMRGGSRQNMERTCTNAATNIFKAELDPLPDQILFSCVYGSHAGPRHLGKEHGGVFSQHTDKCASIQCLIIWMHTADSCWESQQLI